ncbi:MAG: hypothetical protein CL908_01845 [Deltaproteobacteria bacterium]|nr:hypothetical protein [Deltaproteobacteria bacterium]
MGFWTLSRYADVEAALHQPDVYISSKGIAVGVQGQSTDDPANSVPMLLMMDGTEHRQLRTLVSGAFSPHRMAALEPAIRKITTGLLDEMCSKDAADLVFDFSNPLPAIDIDGRSLTQGELIGLGWLLLVAGHETTTNLISNALILLDQYPDARAKLLADPSLIPGAIEECLRFEAPVQGLARTTTRAVELHGQTIPADEMVLLLYGSANRDERKFEAPERFDVTRKPNEHLSFGFGSHFCLGSGLARLEGRIAFEELLARVPDYHLRSDSVERMTSGPIRGAVRLPVDLGL